MIMNGRVLRFGNGHRAIDALLPWFVSGTLDAAERSLVEDHLQRCPRCRHEVEWLRQVHSACAEDDATPACDQAWDELRPRLQPAPSPWRRLLAALTNVGLPGPVRTWAPWVAALELALLAGIGIAWVAPDSSGPYRTLAAAAPPSARLVVVFDAHATGARIAQALHRAGASIVEGPTAADAYVLSVPADRQADVLEQLRGEPAVTLIEAMDSPGAR